MSKGACISESEPLWGSDGATTHVRYGDSHSGSESIPLWTTMSVSKVPLYVPQWGLQRSDFEVGLTISATPQPIGFSYSCGDIHHPQDRVAQLVEQRTFNP